ncbi:hypothetical protein, partial [Vibrio sp. 10N.222.49.B4]
DTIDEANETFTLTVGGESNTATIIDNDDTPTISGVKPAVDAQGTQVDEGEGAVFEVSLSNPSATDMTFDFALAEGTAIAADFDKDPS